MEPKICSTKRYPVWRSWTSLKMRSVLRTAECRGGRKMGPWSAAVHVVLGTASLLKFQLYEIISQGEWESDMFQTKVVITNTLSQYPWLQLYTYLAGQYDWKCGHVAIGVYWKPWALKGDHCWLLCLLAVRSWASYLSLCFSWLHR